MNSIDKQGAMAIWLCSCFSRADREGERALSCREVGVVQKKANSSMQGHVFWEAAAEPRVVPKTQRKVRT
jgi:hypothetical protein